MTRLIVRRAAEQDVEGIARVSRAAGQPAEDSGVDPRYVRSLLEHATVLVAASAGGPVLGWGATRATPPGELLADLFVAPAAQGQGIGQALLRELWPAAPGSPGRFTFSSRDPRALPLYARAGLRPIWPLLDLSGDARRLPTGGARARRVGGEEAAEGELRLSGCDRRADYRHWVEAPAASGVLVHDGDRLIAAGAGRPAGLTHLTCMSSHDALVAVTAALSALGGDRATVCLPGPHPALRWLLEHGWRVADHDLAMVTPDVELRSFWAYAPGAA
jgi:GNAT superfamily N-acetyltransferase